MLVSSKCVQYGAAAALLRLAGGGWPGPALAYAPAAHLQGAVHAMPVTFRYSVAPSPHCQEHVRRRSCCTAVPGLRRMALDCTCLCSCSPSARCDPTIVAFEPLWGACEDKPVILKGMPLLVLSKAFKAVQLLHCCFWLAEDGLGPHLPILLQPISKVCTSARLSGHNSGQLHV